MDNIRPVRPTQPAPQPVAPPRPTPAKKPVSLLKKWWKQATVAVVVIAFGLLAYGYVDTKNQLLKLSDPQKASETEASQLAGEIGKYFMLPNETPSLATISDANKLKQQEFFKDAQNGDKVLIYTQAGRALLYRPSNHKVVEYSKVDLNDADTQ